MISVNMIYRSSIETLCIQSVSCKMALMMTDVLSNLDHYFEKRKEIVLDLSSAKRRLATMGPSHPEHADSTAKVI